MLIVIIEACNGVIQNSGSLSTKNESSSMNIHSVKNSELIEKIFEKLMVCMNSSQYIHNIILHLN